MSTHDARVNAYHARTWATAWDRLRKLSLYVERRNNAHTRMTVTRLEDELDRLMALCEREAEKVRT